MNEKSSQIIEQINAIKSKLIKYSSNKTYDKVCSLKNDKMTFFISLILIKGKWIFAYSEPISIEWRNSNGFLSFFNLVSSQINHFKII